MSDKLKKISVRIAAALGLFLIAFVVFGCVAVNRYVELGTYLAIVLIAGYDVLWTAVRNICSGRVFDENFLMLLAAVGAFVLGEYTEACAVILFYQVGEIFQKYAVGKSRKSIAALMDIRPTRVSVLRDGEETEVCPEEVGAGEVFVVRPGERIALDGVIEDGSSALDTSALTGESLPRDCFVGDEVLGGCVNVAGVLRVRAAKRYEDSTVAKILDLVENAASKKAKSENFITKFARYYTPAVVVFAVLLAVIPSLIIGEWSVWIGRALTFLVVSCPCALVISVPMSFFGGIGCASKHGILVKGSNYIELLEKVRTVALDKTGTITKGEFSVTEVVPENRREEILRLAAIAESGSTHPIARSIIRAYGGAVETGWDVCEETGFGMIAERDGSCILAGNAELLARYGVRIVPNDSTAATAVHVARDGAYCGCICISDTPKTDSKAAIAALHDMGVRTVMLTGDAPAVAARVAADVGVRDYRAKLLPADKVNAVETLMTESRPVAFVGDGINDAPVLVRSDLGIAMGGIGSDSAVEAADVVLMYDTLSSLPLAKRIARKTMRIVRENIAFALIVKFSILLLGAVGLANMWLAVFADVGVAVIAILNAMRAMRIK